MRKMGVAAREASRALARAETGAKNRALNAAAAEIRRQTDAILKANAADAGIGGDQSIS